MHHTDKVQKELDRGRDISIINLIQHITEHACEKRASDIHFDGTEKGIRVRFRVDGILKDFYKLPPEISPEIVSRIKILSGLRTDERQAPQDGRFRLLVENLGQIDVRVSTVPAYHGEDIVLRLLMNGTEEFSLESLGFSKADQEKIVDAIQNPYGMILATGPTGSGKTTTLYTLVKMVNSQDVSIVTIEDPIEYEIDGIKQIQVNPRAGLTFANGLRSILRQDPNVIMVGEIRDGETANIAVNTALTGHLLLSTLHTNDAVTTLPRLLDMKIEPYLAASTVTIAIGQRLVRKICKHCKAEKKISPDEGKRISEISKGKIKDSLYHGKGCEKCNETGYSGRMGIYEVLRITNTIRDAIVRKASSSEIKKIALEEGMTPMFEDGLQKVKRGETTLEELLRVIHE